MIRKKALMAMLLILLIIPINKSCKQVEKVTDDAIEYSLNKLGDTFFSLIAESPEKDEMRKKYDAFVERSVDGEVEQEQIEYVAANMLNASNSQDRINPQLASNIVETTEPISPKDETTEKTQMRLDEKKKKSLGEKLSKILDFNEKLKESYAENDFSEKVFYKFDKGIQINLDEELKSILDERGKSIEVIKEFQENQDFSWVEDLAVNLKMEQEKIKQEMKNLENLKELKNLEFDFKDFRKDGNYRQFYFNDTSFMMPNIPMVNVDSILQSVEQSLKDAGIK